MKRITVPDFQKKQHILYIDRKPAHGLISYGDLYVEAGRIADALDFYQRANHLPGLEKIRGMAESAGDVMLFQQVAKAMGRIVSEEEWNRIGQQALDLGKYTFSLYAFDQSGNAPMRDRVRGIIQTGDSRYIS